MRIWPVVLGWTLSLAVLNGQSVPASYARIAVLQPHDGDTIDFEAGYIRHLAWHRQAGDSWTWFGWTVWAGERQRWFVYATFGRSAADFDHAVAPGDDERDNIANVTPHARFVENGVYEFLPALSRGNGVPSPTPRLEYTTVRLKPGSGAAFEAAVAKTRPSGETLWFRLRAGAEVPRYVRLRPRATLAAFLSDSETSLPDAPMPFVNDIRVEILNLRPTMSLGLADHVQ